MSLNNNLLRQFCSVQTERSESFLNLCISGQIKKLNCWAKIHRKKQEWRERGYHFAFLVPFAVFPHHQLHLAPDYHDVQAKGTECFPVYHRQDDNRNRYMKMAIQEQEQSDCNSSHKKTRKYQRINPNQRNPYFNTSLRFGWPHFVFKRRLNCEQTVKGITAMAPDETTLVKIAAENPKIGNPTRLPCMWPLTIQIS